MIDFIHILLFLSPTIIYFSTKKSIENNYNLRKDFKLKGVNTSVLPDEVLRKFNDIDERKILEQQFGPAIIEFINIIKQNIPNSDLTLFYNNFNNISTTVKNFNISNFLSGKQIGAQWLPEKNTIEISKDNYKSKINHELFHVSNTYIDPNTNICYCGFEQMKSNDEKIGEGLNEGYTQYLTEKYFNTVMKAYSYEKKIAECIELIVGQEKMQSLYFNANLKGLIKNLEQYNTEEKIYNFITTLDFLNKHLEDKYLTTKSQQIIFDSLQNINSFLIETYIHKLILDYPEQEIDVKGLIENIYPLLTKMPNVKINKKEFDVLNQNFVINIINQTLSNYKASIDKNSILK